MPAAVPASVPVSSWTDTAPPAPETTALSGEVVADVAIVGGGFTGLSAALHVAEKSRSVVLVEAAEPGFGASGRNGGQIIAGLKEDPDAILRAFGPERGEEIVRFAGGAPDVVFDLIKRHGIACEVVRGGWLQAIHAPVARPAMEARVRQWQARGAPVELLDRDGTERLTGTRRFPGGMLDRRGGTINPLAFARGLAQAAIAAGARIHTGTTARSLRRQGDAWEIETADGRVHAGRVLLATNAYSGDLWPALERSIVPVYSYQIATVPLGANLRGVLMPNGLGLSDTRRLLNYCRQDAKGRLLVGGRGRFREGRDRSDYAPIVEALRRLFPEAAELSIEHSWGGRVALTLDHYPHLGELAPGLCVAAGYNGRGVALAAATGRMMAEHLAGAPLGTLPLPVRPMRPLPMHGMRIVALQAAVGTKRLQDWWEMRGG